MTEKTYPETRYWGKRILPSGGLPVYKQILPDGEPTELPLAPSLKIREHSPDGFQWGYSGSGPAQLALALLLDALTDPETAQQYYQDFKFDVVAAFKDDWEITGLEILEWLARTKARELQHKVEFEPNKN